MDILLDNRPRVGVANASAKEGPSLSRKPKILIVDHDVDFGRTCAAHLAESGFIVETVGDVPKMKRARLLSAFDLVILDVLMPDVDGLSICRQLTSEAASIIIVSAIAEVEDRIVGLELGADDYLAKPCSPPELLARVRAVLRGRRQSRTQPQGIGNRYWFGGFELDARQHRLIGPSGGNVPLTHGEVLLLIALLDHPARVLSRSHLVNLTRNDATETSERVVDIQISRVRGKLGGCEGKTIIRTVPGTGYKLGVPVARL
jgi:two-component system, OmpR family, response regulator